MHCFGWLGNALNYCFSHPYPSQPGVPGAYTIQLFWVFQHPGTGFYSSRKHVKCLRSGWDFSLFEDGTLRVQQFQAWVWPLLSGWLLPIKLLTGIFMVYHHLISCYTFPWSSLSLPINQWSSNFLFSLSKLCSFTTPHGFACDVG